MSLTSEALTDELQWELSLSGRVGAMVLQGFFYGFFASALLSALYLLCMSRRDVSRPLILLMIAMFSIATADVSLSVFRLFRYVLNGTQIPGLRPRPSVLFSVSNYALANIVLIYRCYVVWSQKRCILFLTAIPLVGITIAGCILESSPSLFGHLFIYLWATFGYSTGLSLCIGGRILYSARRAGDAYRGEMPGKLYSTASVMIDSGVLYSAYLVLVLGFRSATLRLGLSQIAGIVSTLVIVQKFLNGYLHQVDDASSVRSAPGSRGRSTPVLDSIFSMAGNTTAPSLIATTLPHASAHVLVDTVRDAPDGQSVDTRRHSRYSNDARPLRIEA